MRGSMLVSRITSKLYYVSIDDSIVHNYVCTPFTKQLTVLDEFHFQFVPYAFVYGEYGGSKPSTQTKVEEAVYMASLTPKHGLARVVQGELKHTFMYTHLHIANVHTIIPYMCPGHVKGRSIVVVLSGEHA